MRRTQSPHAQLASAAKGESDREREREMEGGGRMERGSKREEKELEEKE